MNRNIENPYEYKFSPNEIRMSIIPHLYSSLAQLNEIDSKHEQYYNEMATYKEMTDGSEDVGKMFDIYTILSSIYLFISSIFKNFLVFSVINTILFMYCQTKYQYVPYLDKFSGLYSSILQKECTHPFIYLSIFVSIIFAVIQLILSLVFHKSYLEDVSEKKKDVGNVSKEYIDSMEKYEEDLKYIPVQYQNPEAIKYFISYFNSYMNYQPCFNECFASYEEHKEKLYRENNFYHNDEEKDRFFHPAYYTTEEDY